LGRVLKRGASANHPTPHAARMGLSLLADPQPLADSCDEAGHGADSTPFRQSERQTLLAARGTLELLVVNRCIEANEPERIRQADVAELLQGDLGPREVAALANTLKPSLRRTFRRHRIYVRTIHMPRQLDRRAGQVAAGGEQKPELLRRESIWRVLGAGTRHGAESDANRANVRGRRVALRLPARCVSPQPSGRRFLEVCTGVCTI
jgi:hypothetical protein